MNLDVLTKYAKQHFFKVRELIIAEGDYTSKDLFILLSGEARVYKNYGKSDMITLSAIMPGQVFGEMSLFCGSPRSATVVATQDSVAVSLTKENFTELCRHSPETTFQIAQILCERLDAANKTIMALTPKSNAEAKGTGSVAIWGNGADIYPEGHKTYDIVEPDTYKNYVALMKRVCPVCKNDIVLCRQLLSKERPLRVADSDMRRYIIDFEPLWYNISTCPFCYFSMFDDVFDNPAILVAKDIAKKLEKLRREINLNFQGTKTLDMVFTSYYLALMCSEYYVNYKQLQARLWLELSWLYDTAKDKEMCTFATDKAIITYRRMYSECNMSIESEQSTCLILGTLCQRVGKYEEAVQYFYKVRMEKAGNRMYVQIADNAIYEVREKMRALKGN